MLSTLHLRPDHPHRPARRTPSTTAARLSAPSNGSPQLVLPSIGVRAPILPIDLGSDGVLHPPGEADDVGWWERSAEPGATAGQTLIAGHTVHTGGGALNDLGRLRTGDLARIITPRGVFDYAVTKVVVYSKAELAAHAQELFGQERARHRLVLVTCTGWTGHGYTGNTVVFARRADLTGRARPS